MISTWEGSQFLSIFARIRATTPRCLSDTHLIGTNCWHHLQHHSPNKNNNNNNHQQQKNQSPTPYTSSSPPVGTSNNNQGLGEQTPVTKTLELEPRPPGNIKKTRNTKPGRTIAWIRCQMYKRSDLVSIELHKCRRRGGNVYYG